VSSSRRPDRAAPLALMWARGLVFPLAMTFLFAAGRSGADSGKYLRAAVSGAGDIEFQVDAATFYRENGVSVEEFFVRIPNRQLKFKDLGPVFQTVPGFPLIAPWGGSRLPIWAARKYASAFRLSLEIRNESGLAVRTERNSVFPVAYSSAETRSASLVQMLRAPVPLPPGSYEALVKVEDLYARKRGLIYLLTGERKSGRARFTFSVEAPNPQGIGLSEVEFAWQIGASRPESPFNIHGYEVVPNPARSYGLLKSPLSAFVEAYDFGVEEDAGGERSYILSSSLLDETGKVWFARQDTVLTASRAWGNEIEMPVDHLASGAYRLRVLLSPLAGGEMAVQEARFDVLWSKASWGTAEKEAVEETIHFLTPEEQKRFEEMSRGERERFLGDFWKSKDPTPGTARNEVKEEFERRLAFADKHFASYIKGSMTDRGRVYVRFGPPDDIVQEVIPEGNATADQYMLEADREQSSYLADLRAVRGILGKREIRAFEVWIYDDRGEELFPRSGPMTVGRGLKFIFIDRQGYGDYELVYSSDRTAY